MVRTFVLVVVLLMLSACSYFGGTGTTREQALNTDFRTGSEGLAIRFLPNLPPDRLFDNERFTAIVEAENKGAFPIGGAGDRIYLNGFDPSIITGLPLQAETLLELNGRSVFNPQQGGIDTAEFDGTIQPMGPQTDKYQTVIMATACYGYKTIGTANVCIDPDPFS